MPTTTWSANGSASWRNAFGGWRTDNNYVYQGQWSGYGLHRGYWFFNDSNIRSVLSGQRVTSVRLRLTRRSSGGVSGGQAPTIRVHNHSSQPGGTPSFDTSVGNSTTWSWGQERWTSLPTWVGHRLRDGEARGICIYTSSNSPYMIFSGSARLEITYEPILVPPATPNTPSIHAVSQTEFTLRTNTPANTEYWRWNPQDAGSDTAYRTVPEYIRPGMTPGTTYNVRVRAGNAAGMSSFSAYRAVTTIPANPATPTTGTRTETSIAQSTPAVAGATGYDWERSGTIVVTNGSRTPNFTGLSPDTNYSFRVRSRNGSGVSGWSGTRHAATLLPLPGTPTSLQASNVAETSVSLSWGASNWAWTYTLRRTRLSDNQVVDTTGIQGTSRNVTGIDDGEEYRFEVFAVNGTGTSSLSNSVTIETPRIWEDPDAPTGVSPTGIVGTSRPTLSGTMAPHADGLLQRMEFQLSTAGNFSNPRVVVADDFIESGTQQVVVPTNQQLEQGYWFLRGRVQDSEGGSGPWSTTKEFWYSRLKVWDGSAWAPKLLKVTDDGDTWRTVPLWVRSPTGWR